MKKFLKRYCWLIVYGAFLIIDLSFATVFAGHSGLGGGGIDCRTYSSFWPFIISSTVLVGQKTIWIFLSQMVIILTLATYLVLYIVKKVKKQSTEGYMGEFLSIISLLFISTVNFTALAVTPVNVGGFIFFKGKEEMVIIYVLFAWLLIIALRVFLDIKRSNRQKKISQE